MGLITPRTRNKRGSYSSEHFHWVQQLLFIATRNVAGKYDHVMSPEMPLYVPAGLTKLTAVYRRETAQRTDKRIKLMSEIINGIQVLLLYLINMILLILYLSETERSN